MLEIKNLYFKYPDDKKYILENVNLTLDTNEVTALLGPSGSGKSTLCKIIAGHLKATKGEIITDLNSDKKKRNPIQLIYQHPEKAINPLWKLKKVIAENEISEESREILGIRKEWENRFPEELSGGELQRHSIARALGRGTKYLIADEITTMLDSITQTNIWHDLLKEIKKRNIGMLVVTHNKSLAERIADRIIEF